MTDRIIILIILLFLYYPFDPEYYVGQWVYADKQKPDWIVDTLKGQVVRWFSSLTGIEVGEEDHKVKYTWKSAKRP